MMERNSAEERRRARERVMMEEGTALWKAKRSEELELEIRDQERIRELTRARMFGRPGHGAPTGDIRKKKFTEYQLTESEQRAAELAAQGSGGSFNWDQERPSLSAAAEEPETHGFPSQRPRGFGDEDMFGSSRSAGHTRDYEGQDALSFGRPGYGAPVRTRSGRVRTSIRGNPEIRFQENESVQKTINNAIRYHANPESKSQYHRELEEQIRQRKEVERNEKERDKSMALEMEQTEGQQWGRPGPGGTYWRGSAVTGQGFFDKMGWCGSADPRKRGFDVRHTEAEDMKREMEEVKVRKDQEHQDINSSIGVELVPLLKEKPTGKPKKDPSTGYLMNHSLPSTDVTKIADPKRAEGLFSSRNFPEERKQYYDTLSHQQIERETETASRRKTDEEEQKRHFESWETFWGRPGYGAPTARAQKENLMKLLHYPEANKAPNNVELITLERLPVK